MNLYSGAVFVQQGLAVSFTYEPDLDRYDISGYCRDGTVVYLAELKAIVDTLKIYVGAGEIEDVYLKTSSPVLRDHINGETVPSDIEAIKMHNILQSWQDENDFLINAEHIQSKQNPAQQRALQEKRYILETSIQEV